MDNPTAGRNAEIIRLYDKEKWSLTRLAAKYELTVERVRRILENNGVKLRPVGRPRSVT